MKEKYMMQDVLNTEKSVVSNMAIALNEASCESLYKEFYQIFNDISKLAKSLYTTAYNKNWYTLENADKTKIDKEFKKLKKELDDL